MSDILLWMHPLMQVCAAVLFFNVNELHGLLLFAGDSLAYHVLRRPTTKKIRAAPEAAAALIFFWGGKKEGASLTRTVITSQ